MTIKKLLVSLLGAMTLAGAANAAVLTSTTVEPGNVVTDYSTGSLVSFDLDLATLRTTTLTYTVEAADLTSSFLTFNALVRNLSGAGLTYFALYLNGISFAGAAGSITPAFGTVGRAGYTKTTLDIVFSAAEFAELHIGNPVVEAGKIDWRLSTAGLAAGDTFVITSAIPEPGNIALMLAGLCAFGLLGRRRDGR